MSNIIEYTKLFNEAVKDDVEEPEETSTDESSSEEKSGRLRNHNPREDRMLDLNHRKDRIQYHINRTANHNPNSPFAEWRAWKNQMRQRRMDKIDRKITRMQLRDDWGEKRKVYMKERFGI